MPEFEDVNFLTLDNYWLGRVGSPITIDEVGLLNRGLLYGDGFFETIYFDSNSQLRFIADHVVRANYSFQQLGSPLEIGEYFFASILSKIFIPQKSVLRFTFFRNGEGLFTPSSINEFCWLLTSRIAPENFQIINSWGVAESVSVVNFIHPKPALKQLGCLPYVKAGIERRTKNFDEIVLVNNQQAICEGGSSNIFWLKEDVVYTPSLLTGCIPGVMRKNIIRAIQSKGLTLIETINASPEELNSADEIFFTNATGIKSAQTNQFGRILNSNVAKQIAQKMGLF